MGTVEQQKPFKMKLSGSRGVIVATSEHLVQQCKADVTIRNKGARSTLTALVPQEHARAAMALLGLP